MQFLLAKLKSRSCILQRFVGGDHSGFTLIEMLIASAIFAIFATVAVGAVVGIEDAELKASKLQDIQDNLRFSLEAMAREMRTGVNFVRSGGATCVPVGTDCTRIDFTAVRSDGTQEIVGYCKNGNFVNKVFNSGACASGAPVTDDNITVEQLFFYTYGENSGAPDGQPRITVTIRARSATPELEAVFNLQTTITQRNRDQ